MTSVLSVAVSCSRWRLVLSVVFRGRLSFVPVGGVDSAGEMELDCSYELPVDAPVHFAKYHVALGALCAIYHPASVFGPTEVRTRYVLKNLALSGMHLPSLTLSLAFIPFQKHGMNKGDGH